MLTIEAARLRKRFEDWCAGRSIPTLDDYLRFLRDLHALEFKIAMHELQVNLKLVDVAVALERPDSNVIVFPRSRVAVPAGDGGAS